MASNRNGGDVDPVTSLHNRVTIIRSFSYECEKALPVPEFNISPLGDSRVPIFTCSATMLGRKFTSMKFGNKLKAKQDLALKLSEFIDGLGGVEGVTSHSSSHLTSSPSLVGEGGGKKWWEEVNDNKQKKNRKGAQAILKSRETLLMKLKNYGNFEKILIRCKCGVLNMIRHSKCSACKSELVAVAGQGRMVVIFLDLERCHGDLESTPTSVGLVARIGEVVVEKELFVMIDEGGRWELPRREDYIPKYVTGLYYEGSGADRRMMKRHVEDKNMKGKKKKQSDKKDDKVLEAVSERKAVEEFLSFIRKYKATVVVFHGEDDKTLQPWLEKFGKWDEFNNSIIKVDSQGFFKLIDEFTPAGKDIQVNLAKMVTTYGDEEVMKRYQAENHSALTDAWALEGIVSGDSLGLRDRWADWLEEVTE